jgi:uncharacterized protein YuzE
MKVKYDHTADAAYIYLAPGSDSGSFGFTYTCDEEKVGGLINLDFDTTGHLIGIEVLDASKKLPTSLFADQS